MRVKLRTMNKVTIVDLAGDLIMGEITEEVGAEVRAVLQSGAKGLAVNLAGVNYIDSRGMGVLVGVYTRAQKAGAKCVFFGVRDALLSIFKVAHLDAIFEFLPDEASAVAHLESLQAPRAAA